MKHYSNVFRALFFCLVSLAAPAYAQSGQQVTANTSQIEVLKTDKENVITINFTVMTPVENALILIRNEKGDLVFMENRNRFKGSYTRTVSLKEAEGKQFVVQIKNDAEQISRTISMR